MPMTIKEKIEAYVKAQGNQVGAGAELAAILNDIVDSIPGEYTLPPASAQTLGGIKVGENLSITEEGVLSAEGGGGGALIVEGTIDGGSFLENGGQPSLTEGINAFLSGIPVILKFTYDGTQWACLVNAYDKDEMDSENLRFNYAGTTGVWL